MLSTAERGSDVQRLVDDRRRGKAARYHTSIKGDDQIGSVPRHGHDHTFTWWGDPVTPTVALGWIEDHQVTVSGEPHR
jgi:hypothetical protein